MIHKRIAIFYGYFSTSNVRGDERRQSRQASFGNGCQHRRSHFDKDYGHWNAHKYKSKPMKKLFTLGKIDENSVNEDSTLLTDEVLYFDDVYVGTQRFIRRRIESCSIRRHQKFQLYPCRPITPKNRFLHRRYQKTVSIGLQSNTPSYKALQRRFDCVG